MGPFTVMMFVLTISFFITGRVIAKGETGWIKSFDRAKYKSREEYAKFLGKTIASIGLVTLAAGLLSLILSVIIPLILMIAGIIGVIILAAKLSKKYYK